MKKAAAILIMLVSALSVYSQYYSNIPSGNSTGMVGKVGDLYVNSSIADHVTYVRLVPDASWAQTGDMSIGSFTRSSGYVSFPTEDRHLLAVFMQAISEGKKISVRIGPVIGTANQIYYVQYPYN
jgi:hypothetical protein